MLVLLLFALLLRDYGDGHYNRRMSDSTTLVLEVAREAAQIAGEILLQGFGKVQTSHIDYKGEIDLVTTYDRASEAAVVTLLQKRFPTHRILAEEGGIGGDDADHRWIIDPLDGTSNFAHGYPCFAVSIAYEYRGDLAVGVIYDPTRQEWFEGERGGGARLNGTRLHVSTAPDLLHSMIASGFPYNRAEVPDALLRWGRFIHAARALRRDGSAALDLAYVAAGRFDGFYEARLSPWDMAAGILLIREAGGTVTDFEGHHHTLDRHDLVASNGAIHAAMLELIPGA